MFRRMTLNTILLVAVLLSACSPRPQQLTPTGETQQVKLRAYSFLFVEAVFPASHYTTATRFGMLLDENYAHMSDNLKWQKLFEEVQYIYAEERKSESKSYSFNEIPSIDWLKQNVYWNISKEYMFEVDLPARGKMQKIVSKEEYKEWTKENPYDDESSKPMHVIVSGADIYSTWPNIMEDAPQMYMRPFSHLHRDSITKLMYRYEDGKRYLIINLPKAFLYLSEDELDTAPVDITIPVHILIAK
jgi:hypothetical protein